jgi:hypothetical protein
MDKLSLPTKFVKMMKVFFQGASKSEWKNFQGFGDQERHVTRMPTRSLPIFNNEKRPLMQKSMRNKDLVESSAFVCPL